MSAQHADVTAALTAVPTECEMMGCQRAAVDRVRHEGDVVARLLCRHCRKEFLGVSS